MNGLSMEKETKVQQMRRLKAPKAKNDKERLQQLTWEQVRDLMKYNELEMVTNSYLTMVKEAQALDDEWIFAYSDSGVLKKKLDSLGIDTAPPNKEGVICECGVMVVKALDVMDGIVKEWELP